MLTSELAGNMAELCRQFRRDVVEVLHERQTGHPGGSLSVCEILSTLILDRRRREDHDDEHDQRNL